MPCIRIPNGVITIHNQYSVTSSGGRVWHFVFHEYCGPMVVRKDGGDVKNPYPPEKSTFWPAFEDWFRNRKQGRCCE